MLLQRVISALVLLPLLLGALIYAGRIPVFVIFTAAAAITLYEVLSICLGEDKVARRFGLLLGILLYYAWGASMIWQGPGWILHLSLMIVFMAVFFFNMARIGEMKSIASRTALMLFSILYVDGLMIYGVALNQFENGWKTLIMVMAIVWLNDTGGYFAGKSLGKHKFAPVVSPNKTWEGSIGGALLGIAGAFLFKEILSLDWPAWQLAPLALLVGYVGQLGDLCESLLKRSFGVKDSGKLIPGHGGLLDRIDALMFALPIMFYYVALFQR